MSNKGVAALVPMKGFAFAKQRLSSVLSSRERAQLARVMLEDVILTLNQCTTLAAVYIVTGDADVAKLGRSLGAYIIADPMQGGLSGALTFAANQLSKQGYTGMLIMPADIPGVKASSVDYMIKAHEQSPAVTIVGAPSDGGTNALLCSPPDVIPNCFGQQSFAAHCNVTHSVGITPNVLSLPGMQCDIDRPSDLLTFLDTPTQTKTYSYLRRKSIAQRLSRTTGADHLLAPNYMPASVSLAVTSNLQKG